MKAGTLDRPDTLRSVNSVHPPHPVVSVLEAGTLERPDVLRSVNSAHPPHPVVSVLKARTLNRPDALVSSILAKLPSELIICIAEFLPPIAATCFSLCCRHIYSLLAIQCRERYRNEKNFDTFELLEVLERDLPGHISCYRCKKFHAIKHAERHIRPYNNSLPEKTFRWLIGVQFSISSSSNNVFGIVAFQMAMKRHRQGADSSPLFNPIFPSGSRIDNNWNGHSKETLLHRIVNGSLLVRNQTVFQVDYASDKPFLSKSAFQNCIHLRYAEPAGGIHECRQLRWRLQEKFEGSASFVQQNSRSTPVNGEMR